MNQVAPSPSRTSSAGPARWVTHPTARFPGASPAREERPERPETRPSPVPRLSAENLGAPRRKRRTLREAPLVPFPGLIVGLGALAVLVVMLLVQKAQLVSNQYTLVDLRLAKTRALKERSEMRLAIQRLSALERVDGVSRKQLGMIRPGRRFVLDLASASSPRVSSTQGLIARRSGRISH